MKTTKFYDTCSLLIAGEMAFQEEDGFVVSSITFKELEQIKTAANKDPDVKFAARQLLHYFNQYPDKYQVEVHRIENEKSITDLSLEITNDTKILSDALNYNLLNLITFVTNDLSLKHIALLYLPADQVESVEEDREDYTGYQDIVMNDEEMAEFYSMTTYPICKIGEYLNIRNMDGEIVDTRCWDGTSFRKLKYQSFNSHWLGEVKPYRGDVYQAMLADSLINNKITMVKGPAGSGKTYLSLAYLLSMLDKNKISKIVIFCNTVATKNSAKLGYYPGSRDQKLLDSQIGNLLASKLGGKIAVEQMIDNEQLVLLPMSDIRGYDTTDMNAGIYISEAQNLDISLMKLALQRIGNDSVCIIDGDDRAQVDLVEFSGANNGMKKASKVFRDHDIYGEVTLKKVHRSKIAEIAEGL